MTRRVKRVAEMVRQELGQILANDLSDPRIGLVTVTAVEMSPDLRTAKVAVSLLGTPASRRSAMRGLQSALPHIRSRLGKELNLRCVPEILLRQDEGVQQSVKINTILTQLANERNEREVPVAENADNQKEKDDDAIV